jgi:hypothetical protein
VTALLGAEEIARRLNVSVATAYREMRKMLHVVIGKRALRVSETAFEAYLRRRASAPQHAAALDPQVPRALSEPIKPIQPRKKKPASAELAAEHDRHVVLEPAGGKPNEVHQRPRRSAKVRSAREASNVLAFPVAQQPIGSDEQGRAADRAGTDDERNASAADEWLAGLPFGEVDDLGVADQPRARVADARAGDATGTNR